MPVLGTRTDLIPLSRSVSAPGATVWCLKLIPPPPWELSALFPNGPRPGPHLRPSPPPVRLYFVSRRAETSEPGGAAGGEPPGGPGGRWATHGRGGALGRPSQGKAPGPGDILCSAGGRAPAEGGAGRARRARLARGAAAALAAGSRPGQEQMAALLLLYLPVLPGLAGAFNLDTDNVISWSGEKGSYFGFSLAMHRQLQPQEKRL